MIMASNRNKNKPSKNNTMDLHNKKFYIIPIKLVSLTTRTDCDMYTSLCTLY